MDAVIEENTYSPGLSTRYLAISGMRARFSALWALNSAGSSSSSNKKILGISFNANAAADLLEKLGNYRFQTILADPPWQFENRTGKMAPEHKRLSRYGTLELDEILGLPFRSLVNETAHLYLWVPNALLLEGLKVMEAWGFKYKTNIVWHKIRKDGGPDGRGGGFYFRNVTEMVLFGVRGKNARTLAPGHRQVNFLATQKREHSRKPDEIYEIIEACSPVLTSNFLRGVSARTGRCGVIRPTAATIRHGTLTLIIHKQ